MAKVVTWEDWYAFRSHPFIETDRRVLNTRGDLSRLASNPLEQLVCGLIDEARLDFRAANHAPEAYGEASGTFSHRQWKLIEEKGVTKSQFSELLAELLQGTGVRYHLESLSGLQRGWTIAIRVEVTHPAADLSPKNALTHR